MFHKQPALVGVFDDTAKADRAVEELRSSGITERQMRRAEKTAGWDIAHAIPNRKETSEEMKPDFADPGISEDEARYYEDAYEAGYIVLVVHPGEHAAKFDEATVEADVEHAEQMLEQKYQARKAQGLE